MDHTPPKYCQSPSLFASQEESIQDKTKGNPFAEDSICSLNLKETSEFIKSLPMGYGKRREKENNVVVWNSMATKMESPPTPGRPVFSFSSSVSGKNVPSKWDDAEKWLFSGGPCHASPVHHAFHTNQTSKGSNSKGSTKENVVEQQQNISSTASVEDQYQFNGLIVPSDVPLKDKFTDGIELFNPNMRYTKPANESKLPNEPMKDARTEVLVQKLEEVNLTHRDVGTDMTPKGSPTTPRCYTPFMNTSPARRHNTPASRSRVPAQMAQTSPIDLTNQVQECHLANLQVGSTQLESMRSNWSSREEEEEEVSKSLRHFEVGRISVSVSEPRPSAWELEEEKTKSCARYQREEARIQAWVDLQTAKAEAQSRKLEVKIQKMRSELEQKLLKKRAIVQRKAEEWRAAAQVDQSDQIRRASQRNQKHNHIFNFKHYTHNSHSLSPRFISCACFPCTSDRKN